LTPVRTLEFTVSSGAITAKTPGANTPKGDSSDLDALGTERERCCDTSSVYDSAGGDYR